MTPGEFATTRNDMVSSARAPRATAGGAGSCGASCRTTKRTLATATNPASAWRRKCRMNPQFADHLEWSLRAACAATVAAGPSFWATIRQEVSWDECHDTLYECTGWAEAQSSYCLSNREFMEKICPYSCREHPGYEQCHDPGWLPNWLGAVLRRRGLHPRLRVHDQRDAQMRVGAHLGVIFGGAAGLRLHLRRELAVSAIILFLFLLICMPIDNMTKKFAALCVQYMCARSLTGTGSMSTTGASTTWPRWASTARWWRCSGSSSGRAPREGARSTASAATSSHRSGTWCAASATARPSSSA